MNDDIEQDKEQGRSQFPSSGNKDRDVPKICIDEPRQLT